MFNESDIDKVIRLIRLQSILGLNDDRFQIENIIEGGMGQCVKIRHLETDNIYALKTIKKEYLTDPAAYRRYIEEIKKWITLSSFEGVAEAICTFDYNEIPCVVSRWMQNGDLEQYLNKENRLFLYRTLERTVKTLKWVYENHNIIHRDLKPGNILLDETSDSYVSDWGISKKLFQLDSSNYSRPIASYLQTSQGLIVGTIAYSSPEQLQGLKEIDFRTDIYSLGCMIYRAETGLIPHYTGDSESIRINRLNDSYPINANLKSDSSLKLNQIICNCLNYEPSNRYDSYDSLYEDLRNVIHSEYPDYIMSELKLRYDNADIGKNDILYVHKNLPPSEVVVGKKSNSGERYMIVDMDKHEKYIKEAQVLSDLKEYDKAALIYESFFVKELICALPDDSLYQMIVINYGNCLERIGEYSKALEVLKTIIKAKTKPAEWFVNFSYLHLCMNNWQEAESVAFEGLNQYENDFDLLENISGALTAQGKYIDALKFTEKQIGIDKNAHSLFGLGTIYFKFGDSIKNSDLPNAILYYEKSIILFTEALEFNPTYVSPKINMLHALFKLKRYDEAIKLSNKIIESNTQKSLKEIAIIVIAKVFLWNVGYKECIEFCDEWLKDINNTNKDMFLRVRFEAVSDAVNDNCPDYQIDPALIFFKDLIDAKLNDIESDYYNFSRCALSKEVIDVKRVNDVIDVLNSALEIYPDYWKFNYQLGNIYYKYGYHDMALQYAKNASEKAEWRENTWFLLSAIYVKQGNELESKKMQDYGEHIKSEKEKLYSQT